jgi:hypothetical protein
MGAKRLAGGLGARLHRRLTPDTALPIVPV